MSKPETKPVTLEIPITRGETTIKEIKLRKPKAGELRGLSLADLLNLDVNAMTTLLPRISDPILTKQDINDLELDNLVLLAGEAANFFVPKNMKM
ncbi:phage tail assembly protein [Pseudoalteromonas sp. MMG013]|uniref:phage tail assembly protein n=1 Tax=Pseudoalteromonas sp. MMG013 TaxID=2822687 RepID=UPI001B392D3A|nr:phage tail assembly protein [Pseudoalteromonas sp. MMG013]MBQ4864595.1 phage tail assembly protein [Pseudoalteromonas sp. MMG013]